jgi:gluconate 2-dehydrogenase gamma chain
MSEVHNRRVFLHAAVAASAAWVVADIAQVDDALAWAAQMAMDPGQQKFTVLNKEQSDAVEAMASSILPSVDGRPGAREAGAVYFIDRSLSTFNAAQKPLYADGVKDLNRRAGQKWKDAKNFAALTPAQQDELLHEIEKTPFFQAARFDTIVGTFALPRLGGNREFAGWQMLGLSHQMHFQPPFGFYDAEVNRKA